MTKILSITEWNSYIYNKKLNLLNEINITNNLDKSADSLKFNSILKDILKINVFNMSYIAFMMLKFLETSFIPSEIILNAINIYSDNEMYSKLLFPTNINENTFDTKTKIKTKIETYNYIKSLSFIIKIIIEFVIIVELCFNIQCLLLTDFQTTSNNNNHNNHNNYNDNDIEIEIDRDSDRDKPIIFKIFNKINKATIINIKQSTRILLLFKLISKLLNKLNTNTYDIQDFIILLNENKTTININYINYINKKKDINKKSNMYLDTFIINITNYFDINKNINNTKMDMYKICSKYILDSVELIFNNFENIFNILEQQLLKSININNNKIIKLSHLKNVIKNIIDIEIDSITKLFY